MIKKLGPWIFPLFGIIGFLIITNIGITLDNNKRQLIPIILVIIYAIIIGSFYIKDIKNKSTENYIESVYFLGFLYTLIAIFSIFYVYDFNNINSIIEDNKLNEIIICIAIALLTTIVGLVAKNTIKSIFLERIDTESDYTDKLIVKMDELISASNTFTIKYNDIFTAINKYFVDREKEIIKLSEHEAAYTNSIEKFVNIIKDSSQANETHLKTVNNLVEVIANHSLKYSNLNQEIIGNLFELNKTTKTVNSELNHFGLMASKVKELNSNVDELHKVFERICRIIDDKIQKLTHA